MARIEPLLNFTITHDYSEQYGSELFHIDNRIDIRKKLGGSRFPFVHTGPNKWSVVGEPSLLSEILERSPDGEVMEFDITFPDPNFLFYTASYLPDKAGDDSMEFIQDSPRMNRIKVRIRITYNMLKASCPIERCIHYTSLEKYWKFILVPRKPDQKYGEIGLEDTLGTLSFNNVESSSFMGKDVFIVTSSQPVKMKDQRYSQNTPNIVLYEKGEFGKRILLKHIPAPDPGRFLIKELQPNNEVIQIIYI